MGRILMASLAILSVSFIPTAVADTLTNCSRDDSGCLPETPKFVQLHNTPVVLSIRNSTTNDKQSSRTTSSTATSQYTATAKEEEKGKEFEAWENVKRKPKVYAVNGKCKTKGTYPTQYTSRRRSMGIPCKECTGIFYSGSNTYVKNYKSCEECPDNHSPNDDKTGCVEDPKRPALYLCTCYCNAGEDARPIDVRQSHVPEDEECGCPYIFGNDLEAEPPNYEDFPWSTSANCEQYCKKIYPDSCDTDHGYGLGYKGSVCTCVNHKGYDHRESCQRFGPSSNWAETCGPPTNAPSPPTVGPTPLTAPSPPTLSPTKACGPTECVLDEWSSWSDCDVECGKGTSSRSRGKAADETCGGTCGSLSENKLCYMPPVDCKLSSWGDWSSCTTTCGKGSRTRNRKQLSPASCDGQCDVLSETGVCNVDVCCPVDCEVNVWSPWSDCSASCGTGTKKRTRTSSQWHRCNGNVCDHFGEISDCFSGDCDIDCEISTWSEWSECKGSSSRELQRERSVKTCPQGNGDLCPPLHEAKTSELCLISKSAVLSDWSDWHYEKLPTSATGQTTVTDVPPVINGHAYGFEMRHREVLEPLLGDIATPTGFIEARSIQETVVSDGVSCIVQPWTDWKPCDSNFGYGFQLRARQGWPSYTDETPRICDHIFEIQDCTDNYVRDCEYGAWSMWGSFSEKTSCWTTRVRTRSITVEAVGIDSATEEPKQCDEALTEYEHKQSPFDRNCFAAEWSAWDSCPHSCGGGAQFRTQKVLNQKAGDGVPCQNMGGTKDCAAHGCAGAV